MELTVLVFLPAVAAAVILALPEQYSQASKWISLAAAVAASVLSLVMFFNFDNDAEGFQYVVRKEWIDVGSFQLQYFLGVDGLSMPLLVLNALLTVASVLVSFSVTMRPRLYFAMLMLLSTSVAGVFCALDFLLFFLFWELELVPMFLLIAIWGSGRRVYSATKFVLYTFFGSAFMLTAILLLGFEQGTFDIEQLIASGAGDPLIPVGWLFAFLFLAFAIKLPIVPVHTWLPDAHTDAPTAVSVMLAGVLLKMGGYGLIRLCVSIMPETADDWAPWLAALGAISVLYGAFITLRQTDVKRLIAYSSVSHMGIVLLGIATLGETAMIGATYQMIAHGLITGMMFVTIGLMYERTHTREIARLGGLARQMPLIATGMVFAGFGSLGLPSMAGFIAEATVLIGAYDRFQWAVLASMLAVVLSAGYILWMLQRVIFNPVRPEWNELEDQKHWWEHSLVLGLAGLILLLGVYPALVLDQIEPAIANVAGRLA